MTPEKDTAEENRQILEDRTHSHGLLLGMEPLCRNLVDAENRNFVEEKTHLLDTRYAAHRSPFLGKLLRLLNKKDDQTVLL